MNLLTLYLVLLKATVATFSGGTSLPLVREELVEKRQVLTDRQLNTAMAVSRLGPGPNGGYLVVAGYYAAGPGGAAVAYAAMVTPAFLAVVLLRVLGGRTDHPRWRGAIRGITAASAGLMVYSAVPLARDAVAGWPEAAACVVAFGVLTRTRIATAWVLGVAGLLGMLYSRLHA